MLLYLNQKTKQFKSETNKQKSPESPKCLHSILPLLDPIFMLLHSLGQRLKMDTNQFGEGVAKEDGICEGCCVTTSSHPSLLLDNSLLYLFLLWL